MQAQFIKVPNSPNTSFLFRDLVLPYFPNPYHFHPELELVYILEGAGTRFVGDRIEYFCEGDMVLVGPNLPHLWKNDKVYYEGNDDLVSRAIVIQFKKDFLRSEFGELPEMGLIRSLLDISQRGLKITGSTHQKIAEIMMSMIDQTPLERIASVLKILSLLSSSNEYALLSSEGFARAYDKTDTERINRVYAYVIENFSEEISLTDVAGIAHMSATAFCRYFKRSTNKTFSIFLLETRLNYACKLLANDGLNITEVAYESGFNNMSYFNRQFKKMTGLSPQQYRKKFFKSTNANMSLHNQPF